MKKIYIPLLFLLGAFYGSFAQNYTVLGAASQNAGCNCFTITPDAGNEHGAIYQTHTINLNNSFDFTFNNYFGCNVGNACGGNADGMVFSLTSNPGTLGGAGQTLGWGNGYGSQPCSVGFEFDTYSNGGSCSSGGECDPSYNELAIMANGDVCHCDAANTLAAYVPIQASMAPVFDCNWHTVRIVWDVNTGTFSVYFDGNLRLSYTNSNMVSTWFCGNPILYWGWSASTGGGCNLQQVCIKTISSWTAGTNYESCDPAIQFTDVATTNASAVLGWAWTFGDGGTSTQQNPLHTYPGPGTYNAQLIITDVGGCADTFAHAVTINPPITMMAVDTNPLCNGGLNGSVTIASTTGGFGVGAGHGGYQYTWNDSTIGTRDIGLSAGTYIVTVTDGICTSTASYTLSQPSALTATTSSTASTTCPGGGSTGSVSITISGGTLPYSAVEWVSPPAYGTTITGLPPGTYVANFTDANGCSALLEYKATVAAIPCGYALTTNSTNVTCYGANNGTITLNLSGATAPVTYTWTPTEANSGTLTGLAPGTYSYSIKDNTANSPFVGSITISQPQKFEISLATTPASCGASNGQAIVYIDSGGIHPFTYTWSPAQPNSPVAANLATGPISVTVTDSTHCTATASGNINGPPTLTVSITPTNDSCFPGQGPLGTAKATPLGGTAPYTYIWSNSGVSQTIVGLVGGNYIVTVTDAGGCTATATTTVNALSTAKVTHTISQQNIACTNTHTGSITVTPAGGTSPYTYTWNPNTVSGANPTGLDTGLYAVTISDALGCQNTDTALLTQPASLVIISATTKNVSCYGGNDGYIAFAITGGTPPYSYQGIPIPAIDTLRNLAAGPYIAIITDSNNCAETVTDTVTQPGIQSVTFAVTNETCYGQKVGTATATFINSTGSVGYVWSNGQSTQTATNLGAGIDSVTVTDSEGCSASGDTTISQPASIPLDTAVTNSTCYGQPGSVTVTPSVGFTPTSYAWSPPISSTTATASVPAGTNYTVSATDVNQCQETATFSISQPTHIDIGITQGNVFCYGGSTGSITLSVTGGTGGPNYTYAWSPTSAGTTNNPTGLAAGTYLVTVTDQANCTVDTSVIITQPAQALAVMVDSVNIACLGDSTGSITLLVTGGTPQFTYAWNPAVATDSTPTGLAAGPYAYTVQDANACQVTGNVNLTQPSTALSATTTQVNVLCFDSSTGSATVISAGGTPGYTYTWNPNVGSTATVSNIISGSYSVTVTDNNGCIIAEPFVITEPPVGISETETQTNESCHGNTTGSIIITASGGSGMLTYTWNPNVSTTDSATNLAAGTYNTTVTDTSGCTLKDAYTITQPSRLNINIVSTNDSCYGQANGTIIATADSGTPNYSYFAMDTTATLNSTNGQFSGLGMGTYTIYAVDADGCTDSTIVHITQPDSLTDTKAPVNPTCYGYTNGSLTVSGVGGTPNYNYVFSTGAANSTGTIFNLAKGSYTFSITDANGCSLVDSSILTQPDSLTIEISPAAGQVNLGDTLQLQTSVNQSGSFNYLWNPNSGLSCYDCPNPVFNGVYSQTYQVIVTNQDSCTANAQFTVSVVPDYNIYVPNAFAPVGNGANDFWQIFGNLASIKQISVLVFDRIGEKVFESNDVNFKWDGTYKGHPAPEGVYTYALKFVWLDNHSDDTRKGTLTLLR